MNFFNRLTKTRSKTKANKAQLNLESLEARALMNADIDFDNGVLTIEGDDFQDVAHVRVVGDEVRVDLYSAEKAGVQIDPLNPRDGRDIDHEDKTVDLEDVRSIVFRGFGGDDFFQNLTGVASFADGGAGADYLQGGAGSDTLRGGAGDDILAGTEGRDVLEGGIGNDQLDGGNGNDTYVFSNAGTTGVIDLGQDTLYESSQGGVDALDFSQIADRGGLGVGVNVSLASTATQDVQANIFRSVKLKINLLSAREAVEKVIGTNMSDHISGNSQANAIYGNGGNDRLYGLGGRDSLFGGEGNDRLYGGNDNDVLHGDGGNDKLYGQFGSDTLIGGLGADYLDGDGSGFDNAVDFLFGNDAANTQDFASDTIIWNALIRRSNYSFIMADALAGIANGDNVTPRFIYV